MTTKKRVRGIYRTAAMISRVGHWNQKTLPKGSLLLCIGQLEEGSAVYVPLLVNLVRGRLVAKPLRRFRLFDSGIEPKPLVGVSVTNFRLLLEGAAVPLPAKVSAILSPAITADTRDVFHYATEWVQA